MALGDLPLGQPRAWPSAGRRRARRRARRCARRRRGSGANAARHLRPAAQVGRARQVEPAVHLGQAAPGPDGRHRRGQPVPLRGGVVDVVGGDDAAGRGRRPARRAGRWSRRRREPRSISSTSDVLEPEQRGQPVELLGRRGSPPLAQRLPDRALAAAGQHQPVAAAALGQLVEVVDRAALLVAAQLGVGDRRGQPVVALDAARQHQQVAALGVGHAVLRAGEPEGELGAVDGRQVVAPLRGLGEQRRAVEAVVVGDRERVQAEPDRLLDQLGRARWRRRGS